MICDNDIKYSQKAGQAQLLTSKSRSHKVYLIQTDNIIVLDHFFNLTMKFNLIGKL